MLRKKKKIMACGKVLHILWPFQTTSQLLEFSFRPSLPQNPEEKVEAKTGNFSLEKPHNVVLPQLFQRWGFLSKGGAPKPSKRLSELCSPYHLLHLLSQLIHFLISKKRELLPRCEFRAEKGFDTFSCHLQKLWKG